jgi:hypothetical protein
MRSTSHPRKRAVRPIQPYTKPYIRALLMFSHRPQIHLKSPHRHPLPSKGGKVVSRAQHQVWCGASEEIQLFSHNKRPQEGTARKAQSDSEAKLCPCLHVNDVLAIASSPPRIMTSTGLRNLTRSTARAQLWIEKRKSDQVQHEARKK